MAIETTAELYFLGLIIVSSYFLLIATANIIGMRIHTSPPVKKDGPLVSVLVPARNEKPNIERCISFLQKQDYCNYEILVIDDNSEDNTYEIMKRISGQDSRVHAFKGDPPPAQWNGKTYALETLVKHAKGEILLFTDADTIHTNTSISWAVSNMEATGADLISGYVGQELKTIGERITVPLIYFLTGFLIPLFLGKIFKSGYFSLAVGQYIAIKKDVYLETGGFAKVKNKTSEDVFLTRHLKRSGYKTEFLDITDQVFCHMYNGYRAAVHGIGKNMYDFMGKNPVVLILIALTIFLFFCLPFPILVCSLLLQLFTDMYNPFLNQLIAAHILFTIVWLVIFTGRRINILNTIAWPVMYLNLFFMVLWSFYRTVSGKGFVWKDRVVS